MRNAYDLLANFGGIMRFIETTPFDLLDKNYGGDGTGQGLRCLTVGIHSPAKEKAR